MSTNGKTLGFRLLLVLLWLLFATLLVVPPYILLGETVGPVAMAVLCLVAGITAKDYLEVPITALANKIFTFFKIPLSQGGYKISVPIYADTVGVTFFLVVVVFIQMKYLDTIIEELVAQGFATFKEPVDGENDGLERLKAELLRSVGTVILTTGFLVFGLVKGITSGVQHYGKLCLSVAIGLILFSTANTLLSGGWTGDQNLSDYDAALGGGRTENLEILWGRIAATFTFICILFGGYILTLQFVGKMITTVARRLKPK